MADHPGNGAFGEWMQAGHVRASADLGANATVHRECVSVAQGAARTEFYVIGLARSRLSSGRGRSHVLVGGGALGERRGGIQHAHRKQARDNQTSHGHRVQTPCSTQPPKEREALYRSAATTLSLSLVPPLA